MKIKINMDNINNIINILLILSKSVIKKKEIIKSKPRVTKRSHGKNKWIITNKTINI